MDNKQSLKTIEMGTETNVQKFIQVEVYNSFEKLQSIQQQWDEFVESVGSEIFLSYDWCRVWWKYYGKNRKLRIFVFRSNNELVGIIPLFLERLWLGPVFVRTVKIVGSDFTIAHFSLPIHNKYINEVIQKLFESLSEDKWSIMYICHIAGLYNHYDKLRKALEKPLAYYVFTEDSGVQTYFQLQETWDKQLASLRSNERGNIRRNYNTLHRISQSKSESLISCFATRDNFAEFFEDFVQIHQSHWQRLGKLGHFGDWPDALKFHREQAEAQLRLGRLRLLKVSLGKKCLGYQYHYKFGDKYVHFLDACSEDDSLRRLSPGRITFCEQIKKALQEKIRWIDSMRGKYEHKLRLGGKLFPVRNLYIIPKKSTTLVRVRLYWFFAWLLNLCYYRIWFKKIASKLPYKRRALWKIWIRTCGC
ncbi:MAG: GNAT family N-acetyltransferase [Planctomycetota bacterium]|jgi:CelD/BcsL family acetyltransferase involved in cellulose biosynthesis